MRLLNVQTEQVEEFCESNTPPYAILSHTWGQEEVSLRDIQEKRAQRLQGYKKILGCCEQAKQDGFEFVWIDTCCIDKTSSAELAEAINSMFNWYRKSIVCYAYLEDVEGIAFSRNPRVLHRSRWFTRGWTLQELIAPGIVIFFDAKWEEIGSRDNQVHILSEVTGIDQDLLLYGRLSEYSVAQRMSWAAKRQTTRLEDEAYCLLGLFGVTMPLVYGEGKMAFIRLQEQIMKRSDDQSIFAWRIADSTASGLLAPSPACFADSRTISRANDQAHNSPFFTTNKGIQITLPILGWGDGSSLLPIEQVSSSNNGPKIMVTLPETFKIAILNCRTKTNKRVGLVINKRENSEQFQRANSELGLVYLNSEDSEKDADMQTILMRSYEPLNDAPLWDQGKHTFFSVNGLPTPDTGYKMAHKFGPVHIKKTDMLFGHLSKGERGGVIFTRGSDSFGVFLAETLKQSCWELACGSNTEVQCKAEAFKAAADVRLTSKPFWKLPLGRGCEISAISLSTFRKRHGFFSVLKIESTIEIDPPRSLLGKLEEVKVMLAEQWKDQNPGIGWKGPGSFSSQHPNGQHPQIWL